MMNFFKRFSVSFKENYRYLNIIPKITLKGKGVDFKAKLVYGGDLPIPIPERSIGSILFERLMREERRNEIFQIGAKSDRKVTTGECLRNAVALVERLESEGVQKGDYILLIGKNSINMNTALLGAFFMGAVPVPLTNKLSTEEFKIILEFVKPKFFGCDRDDLYVFRKVLLETAQYDDKRIFLLDQSDYAESQLQTFPEFIQGYGEKWEFFKPAEVSNAKEEVALLMKAVSEGDIGRVIGITHYNMNAIIARFDAKENEERKLWKNILMVQKVMWISGIYSLIVACCDGQKLVVMSEFDEDHFGKAIDKYKVTTTFVYSSKLWQIYKYTFDDYDFSSCSYIHVVDGSLPLTLIEGVKEKTGMRVRSCYGINELTGLILVWYPYSKKTSAGQLIPATYGKVLSTKTGQKVGPNERGELCFKGPTISKGYLNNEKATRRWLDKEGFVLTGHYGYYDENGDFFVLDRVLNVIKYKDHSISPREIEGVIKSLDSVKDVCVAGLKHPEHGHYPVAFVALQKNKKLTKKEIIDHVNGKLPHFKRLRGGVVFVSKIPRTRDTGAIRRMLFDKILGKYRIKSGVNVDDEVSKEGIEIKKVVDSSNKDCTEINSDEYKRIPSKKLGE